MTLGNDNVDDNDKVVGTISNTLRTTLWGRFYSFPFTDEETDAQRDEIICPKSPSKI
jgi:hypothetical protein